MLACAEGPPGLVRQALARRGRGGGLSAAHVGDRGDAGGAEGGEHARGLSRLHDLLQQYFLQVRAPARCPGAAAAAALLIETGGYGADVLRVCALGLCGT